jgi:hypothetical protein
VLTHAIIITHYLLNLALRDCDLVLKVLEVKEATQFWEDNAWESGYQSLITSSTMRLRIRWLTDTFSLHEKFKKSLIR